MHIVINNGAHETVGGMPTAAGSLDCASLARACGYAYALSAATPDELDRVLAQAKEREGLGFIEIKCSIGARDDLGRPTTTARENKESFMKTLNGADKES